MLFIIKNKKYKTPEQLRTEKLLKAYFLIENFPLRASEIVLEQYLQQRYKKSLKNMCISLLLSLTFHKNESGDLIGIFTNPKDDMIARLITYGNGVIRGSSILQIALS